MTKAKAQANPFTQRIVRDSRDGSRDLWAKPFNWYRAPASTPVYLSNGRVCTVDDLDYDLTNHAPCTKGKRFIGREPGQ